MLICCGFKLWYSFSRKVVWKLGSWESRVWVVAVFFAIVQIQQNSSSSID